MKKLILCLVGIFIIPPIIMYAILYFGLAKKPSGLIIRNFNNNITIYNQLIEDIKYQDFISISYNSMGYSVTTKDNEKVSNVIVSLNESTDYSNIIHKIEQLNLEGISKNEDYILFKVKSRFGYSQYVGQIYDKEKLLKNYDISKIKSINDNWYYIETR